MLIKLTDKNQILITLSSSVDSFGLKRLLEYIKYLEATSGTEVKQSEIDDLADELNDSWWNKNKDRFVK